MEDAQIEAGNLDSRQAFDRITADWVKFYEEKPRHQGASVARASHGSPYEIEAELTCRYADGGRLGPEPR